MARDGYRGPTREGKKMYAGGGATRADKKAGKKYFGGSEGAGEKKKKFGRERKKILASTRTQPTNRLCTVETKKCTHNHIIVFFLFLRRRRSYNHKIF